MIFVVEDDHGVRELEPCCASCAATHAHAACP